MKHGSHCDEIKKPLYLYKANIYCKDCLVNKLLDDGKIEEVEQDSGSTSECFDEDLI